MHPDPDEALLVLEQIHVMVARSDRSELLLSHLLEVPDPGLVPEGRIEELVIDGDGVLLADPEADAAADIRRGCGLPAGNVLVAGVEPDGHVSAGDVEPDAADRDMLLIGHDPADGMGVAEMPVGAEHALEGAARLHAAVKLLDGFLVVLAIDAGLRRHSFLLGLKVDCCSARAGARPPAARHRARARCPGPCSPRPPYWPPHPGSPGSRPGGAGARCRPAG